MGIERGRNRDDEDEAPGAGRYRDDEDDGDEKPRSRRRSRDDEDEDDRPRRSSRRSRDDEDDADEDKPRRSRRPRDDDEDDDDKPRGRKSRDDDDEDDRGEEVVQSGWAAARRMAASRSGFANEFKWGDEEALIKFIEAQPFAVYGQHWIERKGKMSFICPGKSKCPLCKAGDDPRSCYAFNIAVLDNDDGKVTATSTALVAGVKLLEQIEKQHKGKQGPIDKYFWGLSKSGKKGGRVSYNLNCVKERDLTDDYELDPEDALTALEKCKPYTKEAFKPASLSDLREVAHELADDNDDDD